MPRRAHTLVARLDALGDMLICGPAIRAVAAGSGRVTVLAGPAGAGAAALLPGVDDVLVFDSPWTAAQPQPVDPAEIAALVEQIRGLGVDAAVVLTSFHQSALPTALVLRLAGVPFVAAVSEDYPGALLDVRIAPPPDAPEPVRMVQIAAAAGFPLPAADDGQLAVDPARIPRRPMPDLPPMPYVVLHPGASAPARTYPVQGWQALAARLVERGEQLVVTGSAGERELTASIAGASPTRVTDLAGRLELPSLAAVLRDADAVVVANTGPAHLAAAVGAPVVSLFAPVVPAGCWAPYGPAVAVLGDQQAPCSDTRARICPLPGHPCLADVTAQDIVEALDRVRRSPAQQPRSAAGVPT